MELLLSCIPKILDLYFMIIFYDFYVFYDYDLCIYVFMLN